MPTSSLNISKLGVPITWGKLWPFATVVNNFNAINLCTELSLRHFNVWLKLCLSRNFLLMWIATIVGGWYIVLYQLSADSLYHIHHCRVLSCGRNVYNLPVMLSLAFWLALVNEMPAEVKEATSEVKYKESSHDSIIASFPVPWKYTFKTQVGCYSSWILDNEGKKESFVLISHWSWEFFVKTT